jgi:threonine dehydratase
VSTPARLTLAQVERARETLRPHLPPTPLRRSFCVPGAALFLKLECWQPTGSFKVRGALNRLATLSSDERARGVVAASAGNHALGVAFGAQALGGGLQVTLFVPATAPQAKLEKLRRFPVELRVHGQTYDDAYAAARQHAEATGAFYVHAFDDEYTAAGQGTVALELVEALPDVGCVLVPVGGGGLISAIAVALKALRPQVRIVAVQAEASPALRESLRLGHPLLEYPAGPTLADGLSGGIGEIVFAHRDLIDDVIEVSEAEIAQAIVTLLAAEQLVVEASGVVGVAALLAGRLSGSQTPTVAVLTGGNLDVDVLARLLAARS